MHNVSQQHIEEKESRNTHVLLVGTVARVPERYRSAMLSRLGLLLRMEERGRKRIQAERNPKQTSNLLGRLSLGLSLLQRRQL